MLKLASMVLMIAAVTIPDCGPKPPNPNPTPTPTPTPPIPTPVPPAGLDNNRLLRTLGARLTTLDGKSFNLDQGIQCCDATPGVENSRWPLVSEAQMLYFKNYNLNGVAFRGGPFYATADTEVEWADIGGPMMASPNSRKDETLCGGGLMNKKAKKCSAEDPKKVKTKEASEIIYNPAFFNKVKGLVQYAYDYNMYIVVNIIDTWYCKHASSIQGFRDQRMPWPQDDINACGINMTPVQEDYIRHWVREIGKYPNIIFETDIEGSLLRGFKCDWWNSQYAIIRDEEKKNEFPIHLVGTNNEACASGPFEFVSTHNRAGLTAPIASRFTLNDERNPAFPPNQEISNFKQARDLGLSYSFWRAGMSDADMETTLTGFKAVIGGATPVVGCYSPDGEDPLWDPNPLPRSGFVPDNSNKSDMTRGKSELGPMTGKGHDAMLMALAAKMREYGHCASKASDSVMVRVRDTSKYEEYHAVNYVDDSWDTRDLVLPKTLWTYTGTPPGNPTCAGPVEPTGRVACRMQQAYGLIDCTPLTAGGKKIREEGDPERVACERKSMEPLGGYPIFKLESSTLKLQLTPNPMQVIAENKGNGVLTCSFPKDSKNYCNPQTNGLQISKP